MRKSTVSYDRGHATTVQELYGSCCNCCGKELEPYQKGKHTSRLNSMGIDHIHGGGKLGGGHAVREAKKEYRPDMWQVLCYKCNASKGHSAFCDCLPGNGGTVSLPLVYSFLARLTQILRDRAAEPRLMALVTIVTKELEDTLDRINAIPPRKPQEA